MLIPELVPEVVRLLELDPLTHPHDKSWLSAASGLVCVGRQAYVIADDEHHLGHFSLSQGSATSSVLQRPVQLLRLFEGRLPADKGKRKKIKPDLESLALLPPLPGYPHGALFALGSGSKPNRCRAALLALDSAGHASEAPVHLDLTDLYGPLQEHFGDLNIEGAFVADDVLRLLQRGNKGSHTSACISFAWQDIVDWLLGSSLQTPAAINMQTLDFGSVDGVPLAPTDATALNDGAWAFCAVAENTGDSYQDGACVASVVGIIDSSNRVRQMHRLQGSPKVEGIAVETSGSTDGADIRLLLVTDADDPSLASQLLRVALRHT